MLTLTLMVKTCHFFCFIVVSRTEKDWRAEKDKEREVTLKYGRRVGRKDRQDIFKENGKCSFFVGIGRLNFFP